jgi:hypothetical protein
VHINSVNSAWDFVQFRVRGFVIKVPGSVWIVAGAVNVMGGYLLMCACLACIASVREDYTRSCSVISVYVLPRKAAPGAEDLAAGSRGLIIRAGLPEAT